MGRIGLLLGDDGDLLIENGGLVVGPSDSQNVDIIIAANKGEFKERPALGVGLINFLKKQNTTADALKREVTVNLQADSYKVSGYTVDESGAFNLTFELQ